MESYVLSILGADRAGLVEALAEVVAEHGGNWDRSHMAELAGMFAGMVLVRVPGERAEAAVVRLPEGLSRAELVGALEDLSSDLMVDVDLD